MCPSVRMTKVLASTTESTIPTTSAFVGLSAFALTNVEPPARVSTLPTTKPWPVWVMVVVTPPAPLPPVIVMSVEPSGPRPGLSAIAIVRPPAPMKLRPLRVFDISGAAHVDGGARQLPGRVAAAVGGHHGVLAGVAAAREHARGGGRVGRRATGTRVGRRLTRAVAARVEDRGDLGGGQA